MSTRPSSVGPIGSLGGLSRVAVLLFVALFSLSLVACGDDDTTDSTTVPDDVGTDTDTDTDTDADTDTDTDADTGVAGDTDLPDVCSLLTVDDLEAATGLPFGEGVPNEAMSSGDRLVCDWTVDDPFATAQVIVFANGADSFDSQRAGVEDMMDEETVATDLGDEGYRTPEGSIYAMRVGSLFVQVSFFPPGNADVVEQTDQLARAVLGRLG